MSQLAPLVKQLLLCNTLNEEMGRSDQIGREEEEEERGGRFATELEGERMNRVCHPSTPSNAHSAGSKCQAAFCRGRERREN